MLKLLKVFYTTAILLLIAIPANAQVDTNIPNPQFPNSSTFPNTGFVAPTLPLGDINQQGGIINNNGALGQQNSCGRACFGIYTDFSRNDSRFGVNLSIPLFAPENELTSAQSKKTLYDVESGYIKTISEACLAKDIVKAELSAKGLARIWNVDYKTLFRPSCG